jgi:hypothetical protein
VDQQAQLLLLLLLAAAAAEVRLVRQQCCCCPAVGCWEMPLLVLLCSTNRPAAAAVLR